MCEVIIIILLGLLYVLPYQGRLQISEQEQEFLLAYNSFTVMQVVEEAPSESLIGGDASVEDVPTIMDFSHTNVENNDKDYQDIDIKF